MVQHSQLSRKRSAPVAEPEASPVAHSSASPAVYAEPASSSALGHDISRIATHRPQTKMEVSQPGDAHEQEAEQVADSVMRMGSDAGAVHREADLSRREGDGEQTDDVKSAVDRGLASGGQPLDSETRAFMEPRFGHDFSGVRIHTNAEASQSAEAVAARAYTVGSDIAFRSDEYAPGSKDGKRLLAHELTHVVQQSQASAPSASRMIQRKTAEQKEQEKELDDAAAAGAKADAPPAYAASITNVGDVNGAKQVLGAVQAATVTLIPANGQPGWGEGVTEKHITKNQTMEHTLQNYLMYAGEETRTTGDFQKRYTKASAQYARLDAMAQQYLASAPTMDGSDPSKIISTATGFDSDKTGDNSTKAGTQFQDLRDAAGNGGVVAAQNRVKDLNTKLGEIQESMNTADHAVIGGKKSCAIAADNIEIAAAKTKTDPEAPDSAEVKRVKDSMAKVKGYVSFAVDKGVDAAAAAVPGAAAAAPAVKWGAGQVGDLIVEDIYRAELGKAQGVQAQAAATINALGGNIGVLELQKAANEWRNALETQIAKAAEYNKVQKDLRDAIMQMGNAADTATGADGSKAPAGGRGYSVLAKFLAEADLYMQDVDVAISSGQIEQQSGTEATGSHKGLDVSKDNTDPNADPLYYKASKVGDKYEVIPTYVYLNRGGSQSAQGDAGIDKSVELMLKDLEADKKKVAVYQTELNKAFGM